MKSSGAKNLRQIVWVNWRSETSKKEMKRNNNMKKKKKTKNYDRIIKARDQRCLLFLSEVFDLFMPCVRWFEFWSLNCLCCCVMAFEWCYFMRNKYRSYSPANRHIFLKASDMLLCVVSLCLCDSRLQEDNASSN